MGEGEKGVRRALTYDDISATVKTTISTNVN